MSFIPVMMYLTGLAVFGIMYWLMDGILDIFTAMNIADTTTFTPYPFLLYLWSGIIIAYVVFGGIWLIRKYNEREYYG